MSLIKLKKYNLQESLEIEIKRITCLCPNSHKNKRKDSAILVLLLTKPYAFNILLLVFSQKQSEKKLQRKKPTTEAHKHGH